MRAVLIGLLYAAMALPLHRRLGGQGAMLLTAAAQIGPAVVIGAVLRLSGRGLRDHLAACAGMALVWPLLAGALPDPRHPGFGRALGAVLLALPFSLLLMALALAAGGALITLFCGRR